ncbi:MAG: hypothetical protein U9R47_07565 [Actinomycetota bacterium]|nr:hypothetical protein [Actinomycetota bacterium]
MVIGSPFVSVAVADIETTALKASDSRSKAATCDDRFPGEVIVTSGGSLPSGGTRVVDVGGGGVVVDVMTTVVVTAIVDVVDGTVVVVDVGVVVVDVVGGVVVVDCGA